jgi:hypothetical protein
MLLLPAMAHILGGPDESLEKSMALVFYVPDDCFAVSE